MRSIGTVLTIIGCASIAVACTDRNEITGPLNGAIYLLTHVDGQTLPAEVDRFVDGQGRTCIEEATDGILGFQSIDRFGFGLVTRVTCGTTTVPAGEDESSGLYTQSGTIITFETQQHGITALTTARWRGGHIDLTGTRASGAQFELTFVRQAF